MAPRNHESADDVGLFRAAIGEVSPLADSGRRADASPAIPVRLRQRARDVAPAVADGLSDTLPWAMGQEPLGAWVRPGMQRDTLRRLRRGHWSVQDELDLHGQTRDAARTAVVAFLERCRAQDFRAVRIVHGKGLSSPNGFGVLRQMLPVWLVQRDEVLAFCAARPGDGGAGAVVVLLKLALAARQLE